MGEKQDLLGKVVDGNITTEDVTALRYLPGVNVEVGERITNYKVPNGLGGFFRQYEVLITITISGYDDYDGIYKFKDYIHNFPSWLGGDTDQVRELVPILYDEE